MHNLLFTAILAGLGGMIGWGAADFFAKKTVDRIGALKGLVWAHLFGSSFFLLILAVQVLLNKQIELPDNTSAWLGLIFFGVLQMLVYWWAYLGFEKGQLAVLNPVFAAYSGLVALVSILFFREHLSLAIGLALALIFAGILLLNIDRKGLGSKKLKIAPGLKEVGAASIGATIWTVGWDRYISGRDSMGYAAGMYICMTIAAWVLARLTKVTLQNIDRDIWKFLALIGAGETLAYLSISWGYSATSLTSVVALVSGAFSVPTVILAYLFLKERLEPLHWVGVGLTVIGIVLVSIN